MDRSNATLKNAFRQILDERGNQILKKPNQLCSMLKDYVPDQSKEIKLIANALGEGIGDMLLTAATQDEAEQQRCIVRGKRLLVDNLYLSEAAAGVAVETIAYALGISAVNIEQVSPVTVAPQPVVSRHSIDAEAVYQEGLRYANGDGVEQDEAKAAECYRTAHNLGYIPATCALGDCYYYGNGVEEDEDEAVRLYRLAAEAGHAEAQYTLGVFYEKGYGVKRDMAEAVRLYRLAANSGHARAQNMLGVCYMNGKGVKEDKAEAARLFRLAADTGNPTVQYNLGYCYFTSTGSDKNKCFHWFKLAAQQGHHTAEHSLGVCYEKGYGVKANISEAVRWYRLAANAGYAPAQNDLGLCYMDGKGVKEDKAEAARLIRLAADAGDTPAQYNLGFIYENGCGVEKSYSQAVQWYQKAAEGGDNDAKNKLKQFTAGNSGSENVGTLTGILEACDSFVPGIESAYDKSRFKITPKLLSRLDVGAGETVYLAHDDTIFQTGKHGFVITAKGIHCRGLGDAAPVFTSYAQLAGTARIYKQDPGYICADDYKVIYFCGEEATREALVSLLQKIHSLLIGSLSKGENA